VEPHKSYVELSKQYGLDLERDSALTHACEPLVTKRPVRAVTDRGRAFLDAWGVEIAPERRPFGTLRVPSAAGDSDAPGDCLAYNANGDWSGRDGTPGA
jgi:hypothetical protein